MDDKKIFRLHAAVCKVLGHPLRIEVIDLLQGQEMSFSGILEVVGGLKSNLSQHLSLMCQQGILKVRRDARSRLYSLSSKKVAHACRLMREVLIERLKEHSRLVDSKI